MKRCRGGDERVNHLIGGKMGRLTELSSDQFHGERKENKTERGKRLAPPNPTSSNRPAKLTVMALRSLLGLGGGTPDSLLLLEMAQAAGRAYRRAESHL